MSSDIIGSHTSYLDPHLVRAAASPLDRCGKLIKKLYAHTLVTRSIHEYTSAAPLSPSTWHSRISYLQTCWLEDTTRVVNSTTSVQYKPPCVWTDTVQGRLPTFPTLACITANMIMITGFPIALLPIAAAAGHWYTQIDSRVPYKESGTVVVLATANIYNLHSSKGWRSNAHLSAIEQKLVLKLPTHSEYIYAIPHSALQPAASITQTPFTNIQVDLIKYPF